MSSWVIKCCADPKHEKSYPDNIHDLIQNETYYNKNRFFQCLDCKKDGYIQKSYKLQERDQKGKPKEWNPLLRGAIKLGEENDSYQPFIFLVSYEPKETPGDVWFCYYKDTRPRGNLRLGYGPGGPPVLSIEQVCSLEGILANPGLIDRKNRKTSRRLRVEFNRLLELNRLLGE